MSRGWGLFAMPAGPAPVVHPIDACAGQWCCIHNPSTHHMRDWALHWRRDQMAMQRVCPAHGVGHPDPDDVAFRQRRYGASFHHGQHSCCGCCQPTITNTQGDDW